MKFAIVFILFSIFLFSCGGSESSDEVVSNPKIEEEEYIIDPNQKRIALVIGNADYSNDKLRNPVNDANDIAQALRNLNFEVIEATNVDEEEFYNKIDEFGEKLEQNCVALFYYAGHGIQANGKNYLLPVDAEISSIHKVDNECIATDEILTKLDKVKAMLNIVILDACRNNPFRSWTRAVGGRGLATMDAPRGTIIAYSTAPGAEAQDGNGRNSPFTAALKKHILTPNITFTKVLKRTSSEVTGQTPWRSSSYNSDFYMVMTQEKEEEHVPVVVPHDFASFVEKVNNTEFKMIAVKGGTFKMGSNENDYTKPIHEVTVSDFYIAEYEVTQKLWRNIMGSDWENLSFKGKDNNPVENVRWDDAQEFIKKLNTKTGKKYRLPSEAEWEYVARGGAKNNGYKYAGTDDDLNNYAWYSDNSYSKGNNHENYGTNPVGVKKPNELGIYDMSGNVWEWCQDKWHDNYKGAPKDGSSWESGNSSHRVNRGGSWRLSASYCRVAYRNSSSANIRSNYMGFRFAISL